MSRRTTCRVPGERGAAVVWSLALVTVLGLAALVATGIGGVVVARQEVSTVADLAALAGAQAQTDPCGRAASVTTANGLALDRCQVIADDVVVDVSGPAPPIVARLLAVLGGGPAPAVRVSARAGRPVG